VKGRRGADIRCWAYVHGPIMTAHEAKNKAEPRDHLWITRCVSRDGTSDSIEGGEVLERTQRAESG
jgi:hypothetical protein